MKVAKLKEVRFNNFNPIRFREADGIVVDEKARTARVILITEGLGNLRDKNFYTKPAIESAVEVFNGKQFYVDHPSQSDEEDRPERSVRDLAGYFYDTTVSEVQDPDTGEQLAACFATLRFANSEPGKLAFDQVKTALEYQQRFPATKDTYAGISINGGGASHPGSVAGMPVNMVTEIKEAFSADIVTKPARGGKFVAAAATAGTTESNRLFKEAEEVQQWKKNRVLGARNITPSTRVSREGARGTHVAVKTVEGVAPEAMQRMASSEGMSALGERLQKLVAAVNEPPEDPEDLIADIQGDLDALSGLLDDLKGQKTQAEAEAKARRKEAKQMAKEDEAKREAAESEEEARRKASETEDEAKKASEGEDDEEESEAGDPMKKKSMGRAAEGEDDSEEEAKRRRASEDEDDEAMYGMRSDEGEAGVRMRYQCEACSAENEVMPPKGYNLMKMGESAKGMAGTVSRLRRTLEAKEARFVQTKKNEHALLQENIRLKAKVTAYERMVEAKKVLREAGIPKDVLSPMDLLAFEPHQWPTQVKAAKRVLSQEASLLSKGGNAERGAAAGGTNNKADAVETFREGYKK